MTPISRPVAVLLALLLGVLALYPVVGGLFFPDAHAFMLQKLAGIMIMAILAMSLDVLVGVAGLVSLGHAAFFGLGGYMLALLSPEYDAANFWMVLPAALGVVALVSAVVGALAIRTSGVGFIMITLAFGQMGYHFFADSAIAGGSDGAYIYFRPTVQAFGVTLVDLDDKTGFYYLALLFMIGVWLVLRMVLRSPFGAVISAIGVNEHRVRGLGFESQAYKLTAFVIAGTVAGLAGFLAAAQYGFVNPAMLGWHMSGQALVMVILGGMGSLFGPVLGAFVLELARFAFESGTEHWLLLLGLFVIAVVLALPKGLAGLLAHLGRRP